MKKIFSVLISVLLLCVSLCPAALSVSAADSDDWVLGENAEYMTHNGLTYYPCETDYGSFIDWNYGYEFVDLKFSDSKTRQLYEGSCVYIYSADSRPAVEVELYLKDSFYNVLMFVEESYLDKYEAMRKGEAEEYFIYSLYDSSGYIIDAQQIASWDEAQTVNSSELGREISLYAYDPDVPALKVACGSIFRNYYTDEYYLLRYSEYDKTYFYSDGYFDTDTERELTVYLLEDEKLGAALSEFLDTKPEDELEWIVPKTVSTTVAAAFCSIVFGFIPFALLVFAVIMLIKAKDKKYRRPYIIMIIGSGAVLLAFAGIFILLI